MNAYQNKLDVISNNLANSQTDGYKRISTEFESLLKDSLNGRGVPLSENAGKNLVIGTGIKTGDSIRIWEQGILMTDENPLAIALDGEGFFGVENPSGDLLLTRNGQFGLSLNGELVNEDGYKVAVENEESLEGWAPEQIEVTVDGELFVTGTDGEIKSMGSLKLYRTMSQEVLTEVGEGYFLSDENGLEQIERNKLFETVVRQGFVEKSNVDIGQEMVDMMISQRAYQMNARAVQTADEMWSLINNMKR